MNELIFISILSTLLFACGGGGGAPAGDDGAGGGDTVDDVAPVISALSPVDGATDVEPTATLSAPSMKTCSPALSMRAALALATTMGR